MKSNEQKLETHLAYPGSVIRLGINAHTVPSIANTAEITIRNQSRILSFRLILWPKIFRYNASGYIMHMPKHKTEPIKAIIVSNDGKIIAIKSMTTVVNIRIAIRSRPRLKLERPTKRDEKGTFAGSTPRKPSIDLIIGRALQGFISRLFACRLHR